MTKHRRSLPAHCLLCPDYWAQSAALKSIYPADSPIAYDEFFLNYLQGRRMASLSSQPQSPRQQNGSNGAMSAEDSKEQIKDASSSVSPLKAAADLIQTLDLAYSEMTHCAADAAKDAEEARRNARTASEIVRRYSHRNYPEVQTSFGGAPSPKDGDMKPVSGVSDRNYYAVREEKSKEIYPPTGGSGDDNEKGGSSDPLHAINGTASSKPPPPPPPAPKELSSKTAYHVPMSPSHNRNKNHHAASSADRIAQSHAEDVLALSMELERSKQAYQSEQRMHDDTKSALSTQKAKVSTLGEENQKLKQQLEQMQQQKDEKDEKIQELEHEIAKSKHLVEAAEEDAQLALDLAKESSEKRDEMEDELRRVHEELRALKEQPPETPKRSVRFADESPAMSPVPDTMVLSTPSQKSPSRSMVATGRQLLRRNSAGSPSGEVITLELTPAKSAERRQRLRERLVQLEDGRSPLALMPPTPQAPRSQSWNTKEPEECRHASKLLQDSGRRLELAGHWWRKGHAVTPVNEMEAMTRQYCQSVEFKFERQQKEINELESLCGFLERKLVTGRNGQETTENLDS